MHHSQVVFGGRRSRQLLYRTNSSPHHLANRAKNLKESLCSKAEENQAGEDFNLMWKKNSLFSQLQSYHLTGAHQKVP